VYPECIALSPKTKLGDALKTVVAAAYAAERYAKQIGYTSMPHFSSEDIRTMRRCIAGCDTIAVDDGYWLLYLGGRCDWRRRRVRTIRAVCICGHREAAIRLRADSRSSMRSFRQVSAMMLPTDSET
jgi:hypothetical protein